MAPNYQRETPGHHREVTENENTSNRRGIGRAEREGDSPREEALAKAKKLNFCAVAQKAGQRRRQPLAVQSSETPRVFGKVDDDDGKIKNGCERI